MNYNDQMLLATTYPGGSVAILSALVWLGLTLASPFGLLIGLTSLLWRKPRAAVSLNSLRFATLGSALALALLTVEASSVAWDAVYHLSDTSPLRDETGAYIIRVSINLTTLLLSRLLTRKIRAASLGHTH